MNKLAVLVGPPGSGKSTMASVYEKQGYVRVSQDAQGKQGHLDVFNEAMRTGKDVVVDRMGFSVSQRARYISHARSKGYHVSIAVIHQPYEVCLERCLARKGHETIQDEETARAALNTFFTKYERPTNEECDVLAFLYPEGEKETAVVCDLDGTACDVTHRRHFVRPTDGGRKDWHGFFKAMVDDPAHEWCVELLKAMDKKHRIVYCSGRPDSWKKETITWLDKFKIWAGAMTRKPYLFMRPRSDNRDDSIVKEIILDFEILTRFKPIVFIDDRQRVVDMWRRRGFTCLQCDPGDF